MGTVKSKGRDLGLYLLYFLGGKMKLYSVTDRYIDYLRQFDYKVYDNKEDRRKVMRKYLGIVLTINEMNYYIPMSSPKKVIIKIIK